MTRKKFLYAEEPSYADSKIIILPIGFEKTVCYGKGTSKGPEAILDASQLVELYDEELNYITSKAGIHSLEPLKQENNSTAMMKKIEEVVDKILKDNKFPVTLGGEHSISNGTFSSIIKKYPDVSVLHLDAHMDLRDVYFNDKYSHGSVMARIYEKNPKKVVHVGIRSCCDEEIEKIKKNNLTVFWAKDIHTAKDHKREWVKKAVEKLDKDVYITLDVDVFDPSVISATGTPEPGGLDWYNVIDFLKEVFKHKNVVGFDVVELAPNKYSSASDFTVARLVYRMIGYKFCRK